MCKQSIYYIKKQETHSHGNTLCFQKYIPYFENNVDPDRLASDQMKKVNKQCLLDTPRTVKVSEKTWQVIVQTSRP